MEDPGELKPLSVDAYEYVPQGSIQADGSDGSFGGKDAGAKGSSTAKTSTLAAGFSVITTVVGGGVLSLPGLMAKSGWIGLPMIWLFAAIAAYTGDQLVYVGRTVVRPGRTTANEALNYEHICEAAFGWWGRVAGMAVQYGSLAGGVALYLVFIGDALQQLSCQADLYDPVNFRIYTAAVYVVMVPVVGFLRTLSAARYIGIFGTVATAMLTLAVVYLGLADPPPGPPQYNAELELLPPSLIDVSVAMAGFTFAFEGHAVLPSVEDEMANRKQFGVMLGASYVFIVTVYTAVSAVGYYAYGQCAQGSVTANLAPGVISIVATAAILTRTICAIPIVLHPVCLSLEENFKVSVGWHRAILRITLLTACAAVAIFVPNFQTLLALVGASCIANSVYVLPALITFKLDRKRDGWPIRATLMTLSLAVGAVCTVVGTASAFYELIGTTDWSFSSGASCGAARPFSSDCSFACSDDGDFTSICDD